MYLLSETGCGPLDLVKGWIKECFSIPRHFKQVLAPNFVGTFLRWSIPLPTCAPIHKAGFMKPWMTESVVNELDRHRVLI